MSEYTPEQEKQLRKLIDAGKGELAKGVARVYQRDNKANQSQSVNPDKSK
jgi:hypothetical protein